MSEPVVELVGLTVAVAGGDKIVEDVQLCLRQGEIVGLVGESGSGKTTTALSLLGYASRGARITAGRLSINGEPVEMSEAMRPLRGSVVAYIPQDPGRALNPALRIRSCLDDVVDAHARSGSAGTTAEERLEVVGLPAALLSRFPHQLSGGQQQRVCIGMALSCEPTLLVLDEPTTGLDVVTQSLILDALRHLRDERGVAMVYVTHDLAVVAEIADRVTVMYAGRIVEEGPASELLRRPHHPYTRGLLASTPDHLTRRRLEAMPGIAPGVGERVGDGCSFAPRCPLADARCAEQTPPLVDISEDRSVRCFNWRNTPDVVRLASSPSISSASDNVPALVVEQLRLEHRAKGRIEAVAAENVSFRVERGSCVGLVGESGSGKTTIARSLVGLHPVSSGLIRLHGEEIPPSLKRRSIDQRRQIQLISQNPSDSLNPRRCVGDQIARPLRVFSRTSNRRDTSSEVGRLLNAVNLPGRLATRFPSELSGGERQRVAIARALAAGPEILVCDEITSALDVSVQATVLELLQQLRQNEGLSILFITHDLGVVASIADEILVLDRGHICEHGTAGELLARPESPYTQSLLAAAPSITRGVASDEAPSSAPA